jgi:hypothetical protein
MTLALVPKPPTDAEFIAVFNRLCVALREPQDDTGITQGVYFDALKDLPLDVLTEGAAALSRESGRKFFPTTAEWRTAATYARSEAMRKSVATSDERGPWVNECHSCEDTGWILGLTCTGQEVASSCGRMRKHAAHDYTMPCPCRPTNRTYRRHHGLP